MPVPEVGVTFEDGCFSTLLTRVTEADGIGGRHEYSRVDPFNADASMILLVRDDGDYAVYRTGSYPYNDAGNLVAVTSGIAEPRWDRDDPESLWGLNGFEIVRDNVVSGERVVVKDFSADPAIAPILASEPDIYGVTMNYEGSLAGPPLLGLHPAGRGGRLPAALYPLLGPGGGRGARSVRGPARGERYRLGGHVAPGHLCTHRGDGI